MFVLARRNTIQHGRAMNRHGERNQDTIVKYQTQEHTININTALLNTHHSERYWTPLTTKKNYVRNANTEICIHNKITKHLTLI